LHSHARDTRTAHASPGVDAAVSRPFLGRTRSALASPQAAASYTHLAHPGLPPPRKTAVELPSRSTLI